MSEPAEMFLGGLVVKTITLEQIADEQQFLDNIGTEQMYSYFQDTINKEFPISWVPDGYLCVVTPKEIFLYEKNQDAVEELSTKKQEYAGSAEGSPTKKQEYAVCMGDYDEVLSFLVGNLSESEDQKARDGADKFRNRAAEDTRLSIRVLFYDETSKNDSQAIMRSVGFNPEGQIPLAIEDYGQINIYQYSFRPPTK